MNLYLACLGQMIETYRTALYGRFCIPPKAAELRSYWELKDFTGHTLSKFGTPYFLDSGAFSAKNQKQVISLDEYCTFLHKYKDQVDMYCGLDIIPADGSAEAKRQAASYTLWQQQEMERRGLKPVPCFHAGEPEEYLAHYAENYPYIALGGMVDYEISDWLHHVWTHYLINPDGTAKVKVHGFGMTSLSLMQKFPWESVDSTTWLIHSKLGLISLPPWKHGEWDYAKKPLLLGVGDKSSMKKDEGTHISNLSKPQRELAEQYLAQYGFTPKDVAGHPSNRLIVNIEYWLKVEKELNKKAVKPLSRQLTLM